MTINLKSVDPERLCIEEETKGNDGSPREGEIKIDFMGVLETENMGTGRWGEEGEGSKILLVLYLKTWLVVFMDFGYWFIGLSFTQNLKKNLYCHPLCGSWKKNDPLRLINLNSWSLVTGTVLKWLGDVTYWEKWVTRAGLWGLKSPHHFQLSLYLSGSWLFSEWLFSCFQLLF